MTTSKPQRKLYIHMGLHKTGTTSIQLFMYRNMKQILDDYDFYYMSIPSDDIAPYQHRFLNRIMISDERVFLNLFESTLEKANNVLISSECFLERFEYAEQLAKLKHLFNETYIIVYIRRQDEWIESLYKQAIIYNHKIKFTINEWVNMFLNEGYLYYNANFLKTLDRLSLLFGKGNIILRSFDEKKLHDGNIVSDFCWIFSIPTQHFNNNQIHANAGIKNREIVEMYRLTNKKITLDQQKELATKLICDERESISFLSPMQKKSIIDHYSTINETISIEYNACKPLFSEHVELNNWHSFNGFSLENEKIIDEYLTNYQTDRPSVEVSC